MVIVRVVDDRVLLLGLDAHYRDAMKLFETTSLLPCARAVAQALGVKAFPGPVEGYYGESPELTEYFGLVRAMQGVTAESGAAAEGLPELARLREVTGSTIFGRAQYRRNGGPMLLPTGRDPLSEALEAVGASLTVPTVMEAAHRIALEHDDISLVGLAARARDDVVLAALRESVILYAEEIDLIGGDEDMDEYRYEWRVDAALADAANRFIAAFNALTAEANARVDLQLRASGAFASRAFRPIPAAEPAHAESFFFACLDNEIAGRCAHLGTDESGRKYHWAVRPRGDRDGGFEVHEFWSDRLWSTDEYRYRHLATLRGCAHVVPESFPLAKSVVASLATEDLETKLARTESFLEAGEVEVANAILLDIIRHSLGTATETQLARTKGLARQASEAGPSLEELLGGPRGGG